ncbi:MAG: response regulator [Gemmatimonadota bacterium]
MARVLVIEDEEDQRVLLREMLRGVGHEVAEARDGAEGLRLFGQTKPDLVVTDIHMPGLDGHDVISALRVQNANIPIIAVSGGSEVAKDELLLEAARLGAKEVVMKPFAFEQIVGAVTRALTL